MYMDGVVAYSLVIVVLTIAIVGYLARFAYKHIKQDIAQSDKLAK